MNKRSTLKGKDAFSSEILSNLQFIKAQQTKYPFAKPKNSNNNLKIPLLVC